MNLAATIEVEHAGRAEGWWFLALTLLLLLLLLSPAADAQAAKTDILILHNGDRITGEIKSLSRGQLSFSTDNSQTMSIEWDKVARLNSQYFFLLETQNGFKYFGALAEASHDSVLAVTWMESVNELAILDVVNITPIKKTFWDRVDGSFALGYSYTKASAVSQFNLDGNAKYKGQIYSTELILNSIITNDRDDETTRTFNFSLDQSKHLKRRWQATATGGAQRNDELGLDLRLLVSGELGYNLIHTNASMLPVSLGLSVNREWSEDQTAENNLEGVISASYSLYYYDSPTTDLTTTITLYPSLTTRGRWRRNFSINLTHELFNDFFIKLTYVSSHDNDPPSETASNSDYNIITSVGIKF
jgi:hypothetical protein